MKLDVLHLIAGPNGHGVPWVLGGRSMEGMDCGGLALELQRLLGRNVDGADLWCQDDLERTSERLEEYLGRWGEFWENVGSSTADLAVVGDVAIARPPGITYLHLSTLIDDEEMRVLSTSLETRVINLPVKCLRGVFGVWRWRS